MSLVETVRAVVLEDLARDGNNVSKVCLEVDLHQTTIYEWLRHKRGLSVRSLERLCDHYELKLTRNEETP